MQACSSGSQTAPAVVYKIAEGAGRGTLNGAGSRRSSDSDTVADSHSGIFTILSRFFYQFDAEQIFPGRYGIPADGEGTGG